MNAGEKCFMLLLVSIVVSTNVEGGKCMQIKRIKLCFRSKCLFELRFVG